MLSDRDIELLESSLDGQLSPPEQAELDTRLAGDSELAHKLAQLTHDRQTRAAAWESLAFDEASVDSAIGRFEQSRDRRTWFQSLVGQWQRLAVTAACLAMFATGMYFRDQFAGSGQRGSLQMGQPVNMAVGAPAGAQGVSAGAATLELRLNDPSGQPLFSRQFRSIEEAQAYLARLRSGQQTPPPQPQIR